MILKEWPTLNRQVADRNNLSGPTGHGFTPTIDRWVTQLGRYYVGSTSNHVVRIWQNGVTGAPLVSGTILATSIADSKGYKWVTITPLHLVAGTRYFIVSEETNGGDPWADEFNDAQYESTDFTFWGECFTSVNGNYPTTQTAGVNGYNTATFKYSLAAPVAATGEIQPIGTIISSGDDAAGPKANVTDSNFATFWQSSSANTGWIGLDAGAAIEITRLRFAPRAGDASNNYELRAEGSLVHGSASATFASGNVLLDTLPTRPTLPFAPRNQMTERAIAAAGQTFRYHRLVNTGTGKYGGNFAEIRWIAKAGSVTDARPVAPTISPGGGKYPTARCQVTLACPTTNAYIYYTVDGTTPSQENGILYSAPFWIQWTNTRTVKAIAYHETLTADGSEVTSALFSEKGFIPNADWFDERGILIELHSGHVLDDLARTGKYYWYGTSMNSASSNQSGFIDNNIAMGVWASSSTDLLNWTAPVNILPQPTGYTLTIRQHVIFNPSTSKYVLWTHSYNNPPGPSDNASIATSSSPLGPWTWYTFNLDPDGLGYKDSSLFQDDDGTAYAIYTRGDQNGIIISKLSADYLGTTGLSADRLTVYSGTPEESPAMFKRNGVYFLITGSANAYNSVSQSFTTKYATATSPLGPFSASAPLHYIDPVLTNYNAQVTQVLKLRDYADGYIYLGDYWVGTDLYQSRYTWMPLYFPTDTTLQVGEPTNWTIAGAFPAAPASYEMDLVET